MARSSTPLLLLLGLLLALASGGAAAAAGPRRALRQQLLRPPLNGPPFFLSGTHSSDMCSRGFMSGARAYRDLAAQERCAGPCVAVAWVAPVTEAPCVTGYEVELRSSGGGGETVRRTARATESGLIVSGPQVRPVHEYTVTVTTKYSPMGKEKSSFQTVSSSD